MKLAFAFAFAVLVIGAIGALTDTNLNDLFRQALTTSVPTTSRTSKHLLNPDTNYDLYFFLYAMRQTEHANDNIFWPTSKATTAAKVIAQVAEFNSINDTFSMPITAAMAATANSQDGIALVGVGNDIESVGVSWRDSPECYAYLTSNVYSNIGLSRSGDYWVVYLI
ncbi:hypothetical protein GGF37_005007 [Kickxella alabastrina]|nr:hypothetical protein GGF37_005007 [Kickxella alabastrina]